jgi:hypothetical protein
MSLKSNVNELLAITDTNANTSLVCYQNGILTSATKQEITGEGWASLYIPITAGKQNAASKPDFDYTNNGYSFDKNDETEILYFIVSLPHSYKEGTNIYPYLHWQHAIETPPYWGFSYRWYNQGATVPAFSTAEEINAIDFAFGEGVTINNRTPFTAMSGTGKTVSSIIEIKLYRKDGNTPDGEVVATGLSLHYYADSLGSSAQFTKS